MAGDLERVYVRDENGTFREIGYRSSDRALPVYASGLIAGTANGLSVTSTTTGLCNSLFTDDFARIKNKQFHDTEEVRYDIPTALTSSSSYAGLALNGTTTVAASWNVVRTDYDGNGNPGRERIRRSIAWDSRASGW